MPVVQMPDGQMVDMPDNPTAQQLEQLAGLTGPAAGLKEIARVVDKGVRGGVTALPGMAADVGLAAARNVGNTPVGVGGPIMALVQGAQKLMGGKGPISDAIDSTKFGDATTAIQTAGGVLPKLSQPQTSSGKGIANVLESIIATITGGGAGTVLNKAAIGAGAGIGGEAAARLTDDNPLARFAGSVVGGSATGAYQAWKSNPERMIKQATEQVTPNDWRRAESIEKVLKAQGIDHSKSQLLGSRSTLDDVVNTASTHPQVRPKILDKVSKSADQSRQALSVWQDRNMPVAIGERAGILDDVQEAASESLKKIRVKSNDAFEAAMPPTSLKYDEPRVKALYESLISMSKSPKYGETTDAGKAIRRYAEDLVAGRTAGAPGEGLNPVVARRMQAQGLELPAGPEKVEFVTEAHKINNLIKELNLKKLSDDYKGLPVMDIKRVMKQATPEFNVARDAKRAVIEAEYNPASKGLAGQLAQMGGGVKQDKATAKDTALAIVFPSNRPQPQAIIDLSKQIGGDGVGQMLREHLAQQMQKASAMRASKGQEVKGPFDFLQSVAGTNAQRQNLEAALKVVAQSQGVPPAELKNGFYKLMRAFETTKDLKIADGVDRAAMGFEAGKNLPGMAVAPASRAGRWLWERATADTYKKIADIVLSPDGLKQLQAIARAPDAETGRQVAVGILSSSIAGDPAVVDK